MILSNNMKSIFFITPGQTNFRADSKPEILRAPWF
jgi:hypothetical protein